MFSKIKIPKKALKFILDKTADFLVGRFLKKVDERDSKPIPLSTDLYERELRKDLEYLNDTVQNLEAVVHHGKKLYEMALYELNNRVRNSSPTIHIHGDVSITVNTLCIADTIHISGQTLSISRQDISDVLNSKASELFDIIEAKPIINESELTATKFQNIITERKRELAGLRNEE